LLDRGRIRLRIDIFDEGLILVLAQGRAFYPMSSKRGTLVMSNMLDTFSPSVTITIRVMCNSSPLDLGSLSHLIIGKMLFYHGIGIVIGLWIHGIVSTDAFFLLVYIVI